MKAIRILAALAPTLIIAACVAPSPPPPPRVVRPATPQPPITRPPTPQPPAPTDWRDAPQTPGSWRWTNEGGRSIARYGLAGGPELARLGCDRAAGAVALWREGAPSGAPLIAVTATGARKLVNAVAIPGGGAEATFSARDPLLDAMAFSRGRFMLEMPGGTTLYLPSWPEISRVIEDCR